MESLRAMSIFSFHQDVLRKVKRWSEWPESKERTEEEEGTQGGPVDGTLK